MATGFLPTTEVDMQVFNEDLLAKAASPQCRLPDDHVRGHCG